MTMTTPDLDLAELDRLHAKATKAEWFYVESMTDEESMRPGGTYADVVIASEDEDSRPVSVLDGPSDSDAELIAALHNAYPSLRARIAELERKEKAFDAIERRLVFIDANTNTGELVEWSAWAGDIEIPSKIADGFDLLTAIEAALAAKESKQ